MKYVMQRFVHGMMVVTLALCFLAAGVPAVVAQTSYGLDETAAVAFENAPQLRTQTGVTTIAGRVIGIALSFVGIIFLILMIYAGFVYMTAGGNDEKVARAIQLATNAAIGLAIVFAAYLLTRFFGDAVINALR